MQLDSTNVLDIKAKMQQFVRYSTVSLICYYVSHLFYLFLFFISDFRCRNLKVSYPKAEVANISIFLRIRRKQHCIVPLSWANW